ncbi:HesB/YadR/YfhF family protein [Siminovitchia fortis]|uniref:HesB/YadR/YfhF family protein n=1 Tax=Siminovitchia fortis TaxID=254758 RepID=UPI0011A6D8A1|nr:HesB/YadR/YfhF family protein [Siminovitchia fortis]
MQIKISDHAMEWFKDEMFLEKGDNVRFFVRYGGSSPLQEGFSLGMNKEEPMDPGVEYNKDGITFFIEERDLWYFKDHDLIVNVDENSDGPTYSYEKE